MMGRASQRLTPRPIPLAFALTCFALAFVGLHPLSADAQTAGTSDALVSTGEKLYLTGCSSCHGVDGKGVRIIDPGDGISGEVTGDASGPGQLRGLSLQNAGAAAAYYYLSTGRMPLANPGDQPRRKEPAYTSDQIDALVAYVATLGSGPALPDTEIAGADVAKGGEVFRANCQACHSAFGSGGALSYGRAAPNLHSAEPGQIGAAVRVGPGQMPVFGPDTISSDELDDLAAYIEFLRSPPNEGGLQIGRNGPVPEGFVIWLFGIGSLLLVVTWIGGRSPISTARPDDTDPVEHGVDSEDP